MNPTGSGHLAHDHEHEPAAGCGSVCRDGETLVCAHCRHCAHLLVAPELLTAAAEVRVTDWIPLADYLALRRTRDPAGTLDGGP